MKTISKRKKAHPRQQVVPQYSKFLWNKGVTGSVGTCMYYNLDLLRTYHTKPSAIYLRSKRMQHSALRRSAQRIGLAGRYAGLDWQRVSLILARAGLCRQLGWASLVQLVKDPIQPCTKQPPQGLGNRNVCTTAATTTDILLYRQRSIPK